jgi:hypothetical protein
MQDGGGKTSRVTRLSIDDKTGPVLVVCCFAIGGV